MSDHGILSVASGVLKNLIPLEMTSRKSFRVVRHAGFDSCEELSGSCAE